MREMCRRDEFDDGDDNDDHDEDHFFAPVFKGRALGSGALGKIDKHRASVHV